MEDATHYAAVEYPEEMALHLERFVRRVGHGPLGWS